MTEIKDRESEPKKHCVRQTQIWRTSHGNDDGRNRSLDRPRGQPAALRGCHQCRSRPNWLAGSAPNIEKAGEAVRRIVRDGKRAGEVIAQIRALCRKSDIKRQCLDMNDAIEKVLALAQGEVRTKRVALRTDLATRLPPVLGDRVQLEQVMLT